MTEREEIMGRDALVRTIRRLASQIVEKIGGGEALALVGIRRGGVPLSRKLAEAIWEAEAARVPVGTVEIALYRDDAATAMPDPKIGPSQIDFDVTGKDVVLVDDVLETGRTVRAAIDCLLDYGRPRRIWLAVLVDRGGRELPIAPDFVGSVLPLARPKTIVVELEQEPHGVFSVAGKARR